MSLGFGGLGVLGFSAVGGGGVIGCRASWGASQELPLSIRVPPGLTYV